MTPARRQIVFINTAHAITHYSLAILPTAVLVMAVPGGPFGESYAPILATMATTKAVDEFAMQWPEYVLGPSNPLTFLDPDMPCDFFGLS
jgi:hypothetical protein